MAGVIFAAARSKLFTRTCKICGYTWDTRKSSPPDGQIKRDVIMKAHEREMEEEQRRRDERLREALMRASRRMRRDD